jgi:hypothetical protein
MIVLLVSTLGIGDLEGGCEVDYYFGGDDTGYEKGGEEW